MKKFFTLPSVGVRSLKISKVCMMVFVIFQVNWATAQNCDFSNPIPPNLGYCSSAGGNVRTVFLGSYCNAVSGGRISGDAFNLTV